MSDQRGVFTLKTTNIFRKKEQWVDLNDVWHSPSPSGSGPETGYFGGGSGPVSTMDKVDYASDTTAALPSTGALRTAHRFMGATGNFTHGYFGGGFPDTTKMDSEHLCI